MGRVYANTTFHRQGEYSGAVMTDDEDYSDAEDFDSEAGCWSPKWFLLPDFLTHPAETINSKQSSAYKEGFLEGKL